MKRLPVRLLALLVALVAVPTAAQDATQEASLVPVMVGARSCTAPDEVGSQCHAMDGIVVELYDDADTYLGACTTAPFNSGGSTCTIDVPAGITVIASVSPDQLPPNTTMVLRNRSIIAPETGDGAQDLIPTVEFWDDEALLGETEPEQPDDWSDTEGSVDSGNTNAGEGSATDDQGESGSGTLAGEGSGDVAETDDTQQSSDSGGNDDLQPEVTHVISTDESDEDRIAQFIDNWAVIGVAAFGVIIVLMIALKLTTGGRK